MGNAHIGVRIHSFIHICIDLANLDGHPHQLVNNLRSSSPYGLVRLQCPLSVLFVEQNPFQLMAPLFCSRSGSCSIARPSTTGRYFMWLPFLLNPTYSTFLPLPIHPNSGPVFPRQHTDTFVPPEPLAHMEAACRLLY